MLLTRRVWDTHGVCKQTFEGHKGAVNSVTYTPDGTHLITGSSDDSIRCEHFKKLPELAETHHLQLHGQHCLWRVVQLFPFMFWLQGMGRSIRHVHSSSRRAYKGSEKLGNKWRLFVGFRSWWQSDQVRKFPAELCILNMLSAKCLCSYLAELCILNMLSAKCVYPYPAGCGSLEGDIRQFRCQP